MEPEPFASDADWSDEAPCKGAPHLFFSPHVCTPECNDVCQGRSEPGRPERTAKAKALCWNHCPVRQQCLAWALLTNLKGGIAGGYSDRERQYISRALNRIQAEEAS